MASLSFPNGYLNLHTNFSENILPALNGGIKKRKLSEGAEDQVSILEKIILDPYSSAPDILEASRQLLLKSGESRNYMGRKIYIIQDGSSKLRILFAQTQTLIFDKLQSCGFQFQGMSVKSCLSIKQKKYFIKVVKEDNFELAQKVSDQIQMGKRSLQFIKETLPVYPEGMVKPSIDVPTKTLFCQHLSSFYQPGDLNDYIEKLEATYALEANNPSRIRVSEEILGLFPKIFETMSIMEEFGIVMLDLNLLNVLLKYSNSFLKGKVHDFDNGFRLPHFDVAADARKHLEEEKSKIHHKLYELSLALSSLPVDAKNFMLSLERLDNEIESPTMSDSQFLALYKVIRNHLPQLQTFQLASTLLDALDYFTEEGHFTVESDSDEERTLEDDSVISGMETTTSEPSTPLGSFEDDQNESVRSDSDEPQIALLTTEATGVAQPSQGYIEEVDIESIERCLVKTSYPLILGEERFEKLVQLIAEMLSLNRLERPTPKNAHLRFLEIINSQPFDVDSFFA